MPRGSSARSFRKSYCLRQVACVRVNDSFDLLADAGLCSAYHHQQNEEQGKESTPTFFLHRHADKPYHIDYAFVAPERLRDCYIETSEHWLALSDHCPLILEIED